MSGRDHEPVSAFFPSIDRNLILDLDRHLRGELRGVQAPTPVAASSAAPLAVPTGAMDPVPQPPRSGLRPDVSHVVEAVEQAGQSMHAMSTRIDDLEGHIGNLEATNGTLNEKLAASQRQVADLEARLKAENERAARIESVATQQAARAAALDRELNAAHGDLARITDAIAATLGFPQKD